MCNFASAVDQYLEFWRNNHKSIELDYDSEESSALLEESDDLWNKLTDDEKEIVNAILVQYYKSL